MAKERKLKRAGSFLLVLSMVLSLVAFIPLTADAAGYTSNNAVDNAIDLVLSPSEAANHSTVFGINLSGRTDVYGVLDVDNLLIEFPNLSYLNVNHTNITDVTNSSSVTVAATDTFYDHARSFVYSGTVVVYRESQGALNVSSLLNEMKINTPTGNIAIPAGMLLTGNVTLASTIYPVAPNGIIAQSSVTANAAGSYTVSLDFPVAYATSATLADNVTLEIKKSGYNITPAIGSVFDGGTAEFILRRLDEDGNPMLLGPVGNYDVHLYVTAVNDLILNTEMSTDNLSMRIVVSADLFGTNTSANLQVFDNAPVPNLLVDVPITKFSNETLNDIRFIESNAAVVTPTPIVSGGKIYAKGGTTITSADLTKLTGNAYTNTTVYLLQGLTVGSYWSYIPERYKTQIEISIGTGCDLSGELIAVPNPLGGTENILALVVAAKTATATVYSYGIPGSEPVKVTLRNTAASIVSAYMEVQVLENAAQGYKIYQLPSIYSGKTKTEIEAAIINNDPRIKMVAHYEKDAFDIWSQVGGTGATIVENSSIYLVAVAYYETGGQAFFVPDSLINGWYHTNTTPANMFDDVTWGVIGGTGATTMNAKCSGGLSAPAFSPNTVVLEVSTGAYGVVPGLEHEPNGLLVFAPTGAANYLEVPIRKVEEEIINYIIAPPAYPLDPSASNMFDQLELEIAAANAPGAAPPFGKLYELNVLGKDTIAIGGTNTYRIWTVFSNYTVSDTYATSVHSNVGFINSSVSPTPVSAVPGSANSHFDAVATANGGSADALAGGTVDMTYSSGGVSSKTVTLTLTNSEVGGLYLVFEDCLGNRYSSASALYDNFSDISQLTANFQIPQGTFATVYAVFAFGNDSFFASLPNWMTYIASSSSISLTPGTINILDGGAGGANTYRTLNGVTASLGNSVTAAWIGGNSVVIGSNTFVISGTASIGTNLVDVTAPLITGIAARNQSLAPIANGSTITTYIVGDRWDTNPEVRLSGYTTNAAIFGVIYLGDVTLIPSVPAAVDVTDYELGFIDRQAALTIQYEYTYSVNGVSSTGILPYVGTSSPDYVLTINVGHPQIEQIFLVAKDNSALTWHGASGFIASSVNEYTLPYSAGSIIRLYPVAMNSRVKLDSSYATDYALLDAVGESRVASEPDYFSYLRNADFVQSAPWSLLSGDPSKFIGTPKVDGNGYIYYEVLFAGEVNFANYLDFEVDPSALALNSTAPYSGFSAAVSPDTLQVFNKGDSSTEYVVDIVTVGASTGPYSAGDTILFDVKYSLSTIPDPTAPGIFEVPATYFNTSTLDVMPGMPNYNATANNALRVEPISVPASGSYTLTSVGNQLQITATMAGTYTFKLYTVNTAGQTAPYYSPQYKEITFTVDPYIGTQTVYWGQPVALTALGSVSGWASIEEFGTSLLDATSLSNGILKMVTNASGPAVVKVKNAAGIEIASITVSTIGAFATSAVLNPSYSYSTGSPHTMAPGESTLLYWVVTYAPNDLSPTYTLTESLTVWNRLYGDYSDADLTLSGNLVTAVAGSASSTVAYGTNHAATGTNAQFWAFIDNNLPVPGYNYEIRNSVNNPAGPTISLAVGVSATLSVFNLTAGAPITGIDLVSSSNTAAVLASPVSASTFTLTALSIGSSTVTVYPTTGGSVSINVVAVDPSASMFTVTGTVSDSSGGISGATVTLTDTSNPANTYTGTSTAGGGFTIIGVTSGTYTVTANASGYNQGTSNLVVGSAFSNIVNFVLTASAGPGPGPGPGPGGSTEPSNYSITVNAGANGTASADKLTAASGSPVTVTVTPGSGYETDSVTAKTDSGANVVIAKGSGEKYSFTMPAADVTVTVTFKVAGAHSDCPSAPFTDVDISLWYHEYIDYVLANGIMQGTGANTFEPNIDLSRAMIVQILYNIEGKPAVSEASPFGDVPVNEWFANAVAWAAANEIVMGYDSDHFGPYDSVTREQMAAILHRYAGYKHYDVSASDSLSAFEDIGSISQYAVSAMRWAVGAGLINGRDATHLIPQGTATRAEVATIVTRFCRAYSIF